MKKIGRYVIEAELGRGGFGKVYRAYDPVVGRPVAIKVLTAQDDDDQSIRFRNEAAASGRLVHKNIVTVHDFGQEGVHPYLVMELVEGKDLSRILKDSDELDLSKKLDIVYQVTEGLQAAHRSGIVHRDIKPANIMLLPNGVVKILDFGIARWTESAGTRLTRPGYLIGSIHYMSPEQFQGLEVDERSDIFSLGVVAYQLLTGKHPFWSENQAAVIYNVTQVDPPPMTDYVPDLPPELDRAILLALQKDRELRYPSVEDLRLDLQPLLFEMKREEAEGMVSEAEAHLEREDTEAALTILRQVLRLDPNHARARKLRRQAENVAVQRRRQARTDKLVEEGEERLRERQFDQAAQKFREALALDPDNKDLAKLVQDCRDRSLKSRRAGRAVERAKNFLAQGQTENADVALKEALEGDPNATGALPLKEHVERLLEEEDRKRRLTDAYEQALAALAEERFEEVRRAAAELRAESFDQEKLAELEQDLASAEAERARRVELAAAKERVQGLLAGEAYDAAITELGRLRSENPGDKDLSALLEQARRSLEQKRKADAIADIRGSAPDLIDAERFNTALARIESVEGEHGGDAELSRLREEVQGAREASERRIALQQAREQAESAAAATRFDEALSVLDACLGRVGADPETQALRGRIERQRGEHLRAQAIAEIAKRNRARLDAQDFGAAVAELESSEVAGLNDPGLAELLANAQTGFRRQAQLRYSQAQAERAIAAAQQEDFQAAFDILEQAQLQSHEPSVLADAEAQILARRGDVVAELARAGREALDRGELAAAVTQLEDAASRFPEEASLQTLLNEAQEALQEHRLRQKADQAIARARALAGDQRFQEAIKLLDRTRREVVDTPALADAVDEIRAAHQSYERERQIEAAVADGRTLLEGGKFEQADAAVRKALDALGQDSRLEELRGKIQRAADLARHEQAVAEALFDAETLLDAGKNEEAAKRLESRQRTLQDERLAELLRTAHGRLAQARHAQAVADCVAQADKLLAARQPERAVEVLTANPDLADAPEVRGRLERASAAAAAAKRQRDIHAALDQASTLEEQERHDEALAALDQALKSYPKDEALIAKRADVKLSRERLERGRLVAGALKKAQELEASGRLGEALDAVHSAVQRYPTETRLVEIQSRLEKARDRAQTLQRARTLMDKRDFAAAIALLEPLSKHSDNAEAQAVLAEAKRSLADQQRKAFVADIVNRASAAADKGRFAEANALLEEGLQKEPESDALQGARRQIKAQQEAQERDELVRSVLQEADRLIERGKLDDASDSIASALEIAPGDARLVEARDRVARSIEDRRRAEAIGEAVKSGRRLLSLDRLDHAYELLDEANRQYPGQAELEQLRADCIGRREARDRERTLQKLLADAAALQKAERYEEALAKIDALPPDHVDDERVRQLRDTLVKAKERVDRKNRIAAALDTARKQASRSEFAQALATLDQALTRDAGDSALNALKKEIEGLQRSAQLREALADLDLIERRLASENLRPRALGKLASSVDAIAKRLPDEPELQTRCRDTKKRIDKAIEEAKKAPGFPFAKAAAGLAAAAVAVAAYLLWPSAGPSGEGAPLALTVSPAGASVTLAGETCVVPDCALTAPAGEHTLQIEKPGYAPVSTAVVVPEGQSEPVSVSVNLDPLPSVLEVVTDLENGSVYLDDGPAQRLEDGRWSLLDLAPGAHTLRLESGGIRARVEFESVEGAPPRIPGSATVEDAALLGISRLSKQGKVFATGPAGPALLDGAAVGSVGPDGLQLDNLATGDSHTLTVGEGDEQRRVIFDALNAPVLSLYLFSDRSVGSVVVRAGQPGVRIQIGSRTYETSRDGSVRALLDVGSYTIRASKSGFRAPSPQNVEIRKGIEQSVAIQLEAVNPVLAVQGGEPGAELVIDGEVKGVLNGSGDTSATVSAGAHEIEIRKDGFRTLRLNRALEPGQTLTLNAGDVQLTRLPPPPPQPAPQPPPDPGPSQEELRRQAEQRAADEQRRAQSSRFESARQSGDLPALRLIAGEANNPFAAQARDALNALGEQAGRAALTSGSAGDLQSFLDRFPQSPLAGEARQKLEQLRQDQTAAQDSQAVRNAIAAYGRAYGAKDVDTMAQLHTGLTRPQQDALRQTFGFARSLSMTFELAGEPQVRGTAASVSGVQTTVLTDERGRERRDQTNVAIDLEKIGGAWKIRAIARR